MHLMEGSKGYLINSCKEGSVRLFCGVYCLLHLLCWVTLTWNKINGLNLKVSLVIRG